MGLAPVREVNWVLGAVGEDTVPLDPLISAGELLTGLGDFLLPAPCTGCLPDQLRQVRTWLLAHLGILLCQDILSNCPTHPTTLNALVGSCPPLPLVPQESVPHSPPKTLISAAFAATRHPLLQIQGCRGGK